MIVDDMFYSSTDEGSVQISVRTQEGKHDPKARLETDEGKGEHARTAAPPSAGAAHHQAATTALDSFRNCVSSSLLNSKLPPLV